MYVVKNEALAASIANMFATFKLLSAKMKLK